MRLLAKHRNFATIRLRERLYRGKAHGTIAHRINHLKLMRATSPIRFLSAFAICLALAPQLVVAASCKIPGRCTVPDRLAQFGAAASARLAPHLARAGVAYPPHAVALIAFKDEASLQLYARAKVGGWRFVRAYPVLAASGDLGPKLKQGDSQVPEGSYRVELLNPNSSYHVSLRLNYPNGFDRAMAKRDKRTNLGGDIMIHGKSVSIGCLAMGDRAAEELFTLAAQVGLENVSVLLSPTDFRVKPSPALPANLPAWTRVLYRDLESALGEFPQPQD